jgi:thiol-disulfide isomerase/thioredoxin
VTGLIALVVALVAAAALAAVWRARQGRLRPASRVGGLDPELLSALGVQLGKRATLLQFSSAFCQPCRATRGVLERASALSPGVVHVDVDAEAHLEAVRTLGILRTPTTLVLDPAGRELVRASGVPKLADVVALVAGPAGPANADRTGR